MFNRWGVLRKSDRTVTELPDPQAVHPWSDGDARGGRNAWHAIDHKTPPCASCMLDAPATRKERIMVRATRYDEIADWYEREFLRRERTNGIPDDDPIGIDSALRRLLGDGSGISLEIGCGTGVHAGRVRQLGWTPVGVDPSLGMLRHARGRLHIVQADAMKLPIADGSVAAVIAMLVHTDMPNYPAVLREAARVLRPGGVLVHVGVHPCFCGGFADRSNPAGIVIHPGYLDGQWTRDSWTDEGLRAKVGAIHLSLPDLLHAFTEAGLTLERFTEGGEPTPVILAIRSRSMP